MVNAKQWSSSVVAAVGASTLITWSLLTITWQSIDIDKDLHRQELNQARGVMIDRFDKAYERVDNTNKRIDELMLKLIDAQLIDAQLIEEEEEKTPRPAS